MVKRIARLSALAAVSMLAVPIAPAGAGGGGGGGGCYGQEATSARVSQIVLHANCFSPTLARVPVGTMVKWINKDPYEHTVTGAANSWGSFSPLGFSEATRATKMRFTRAGVFPYFCAFHPGMVGTVLVGDANGPGAANVVAGGSAVEEIDTEQAQPVAAKAPVAKSGVALPGIVGAIAAATGLAGFGVGRRSRGAISR